MPTFDKLCLPINEDGSVLNFVVILLFMSKVHLEAALIFKRSILMLCFLWLTIVKLEALYVPLNAQFCLMFPFDVQ